jgi:putative transposase
MSTPGRRMLDRADKALSIRRQCMLLGIARSGVYRPLRPANDNDLSLMRRLDELYTAWPFLVARFSHIEGYRWLSLTRALEVVKCQLALA